MGALVYGVTWPFWYMGVKAAIFEPMWQPPTSIFGRNQMTSALT